MSKVRFFNLSEPVVPLFRHLGAALVERRNAVEFVVSRSSYRGGDDRLAQAVPGGSVILTPGPRKQFSNRLGRAIAMAFYWLGACWTILTKPAPSVNVFLTQPPCFVGLGVRLAKRRGQRCVIVVMDVHPDELVSFGALRRGSIVERSFAWLMNGAWRRADEVVVIGRCMRDRIAAKGVPLERIQVIPNWVDDVAIEPVSRGDNRVRKSLDWGDDFVVMYGGNIGHAQEFSTLIKAADALQRSEGIRLVVVGEGSKADEVRRGMQDTSCGEYHPLLHENYPLGEVLSAADVHFISLREDCTGLGVPSKTYAAMAAGRPIIFEGSRQSEVYLTVKESDIGYAVPTGDVEALLSATRLLASDRSRWSQVCEQSRTVLDQKYAARHGVTRYLNALDRWL